MSVAIHTFPDVTTTLIDYVRCSTDKLLAPPPPGEATGSWPAGPGVTTRGGGEGAPWLSPALVRHLCRVTHRREAQGTGRTTWTRGQGAPARRLPPGPPGRS